jgi:hypothetical protein
MTVGTPGKSRPAHTGYKASTHLLEQAVYLLVLPIKLLLQPALHLTGTTTQVLVVDEQCMFMTPQQGRRNSACKHKGRTAQGIPSTPPVSPEAHQCCLSSG